MSELLINQSSKSKLSTENNLKRNKEPKDQDPFQQIENIFLNQTKVKINDQRQEIFQIIQNLKSDMVQQKVKISKQIEKMKKIQLENKPESVNKQEELIKKQTNVCLAQNLKKAEDTFKSVVKANKSYFEAISEFGDQMQEIVKVECPDFNRPFYKKEDQEQDIEEAFVSDEEDRNDKFRLDKKVALQIIFDHLKKEGLKESQKQLIEECRQNEQTNLGFKEFSEENSKFNGNVKQSYQDQFNELKEIISDLNQEKTDSALRWSNNNYKAICQNNALQFIFLLHQVNYRQLLNKAVEIHFHLNYRHLCSSPQISEHQIHDEEMKDEAQKDSLQIDSSLFINQPENCDKIDFQKSLKIQNVHNDKNENYTQQDFDNIQLQIINYIQVNLIHFQFSKLQKNQNLSMQEKSDQLFQDTLTKGIKIEKMIAAMAYIPIYSEKRMKNYSFLPNKTEVKSQNMKVEDDQFYSDFFDTEQTKLLWDELKSKIGDLYCQVHNISQQSSLYLALVAASYSLPSFVFAQKRLIHGKNVTKTQFHGANSIKEMPCEVDLGQDFVFHNIFICPVSKETNNNPMILKCGHVISKQSLNKMTRGNPKTQFKCPTCPQEMTQENGVDYIEFN